MVQKWPFFQIFFLGNIGQENVFYDILQRKNAFLGYKNKKFKKSKNRHFFKGVNQWFWSENGLFSNFFFMAIQAKKMSFTIFYIEKTPLQTIKRKFQTVEKWTIFQLFFFRQYRPGKCLFTIFQTKKTPFQAIKTTSSKRSDN